MHTLPNVRTLFRQAWSIYSKNWKLLVGLSALTCIIPLLFSHLAVTAIYVNFLRGNMVLPVILLFLFPFLVLFPLLWGAIRVTRAALFLNAGHPIPEQENKLAFHLLPGFLWVEILMGAVFALPLALVLGWSFSNFIQSALFTTGSVGIVRVLNILLGLLSFGSLIGVIYAALRIGFSLYAFLDQHKRGIEALRESWNITRGYWWSIAWRLFATSLLIQLSLGVVVFILKRLLAPLMIPDLSFIFSTVLLVLIKLPMSTLIYTKLYQAIKYPQVTA